MLSDCGSEEFVALFGAIAVESLPGSHLVHSGVHRIAHRSREGLGHIADAATDHSSGGLRIGLSEGLHAPRDFRKEVTGLELEIVGVERRHKSSK